ncbi:MAG: hypothetical protein MUP19_08360, partial [Candidatus Aminicenantes bacterium]|nr:hypothetical protein [Candidatus Aminicenantes bacterium]
MIAGLILAAAVCVVIYAGLHLTFKARTPDLDTEAKLRVLRSAGKLFPWNEASFEEEAVTLLGRATENIAELDQAQKDIRRAYTSLRRALKLNPGSAAAHFYYAETLDLMRYLGIAGGESPFQEYEKAARLAGPDRNLIRDIGIILFGRWAALSAEERNYTQDLLKKSLQPGDETRFQKVIHVWDLGIRDDDVMQKIIPESPPLLRMYAQFLADKNLSLEARHRTLARTERLDYEQAWKAYETGQNELKMGLSAPAAQH